MNADQSNMENGDLPEQVLVRKEVIDSLESDLKCIICLNFIKKAVTLNCTHSFCYDCIRNWRQRTNTCVMCRAVIKNLTGNSAIDNIVSAYSGEEKANTEPVDQDLGYELFIDGAENYNIVSLDDMVHDFMNSDAIEIANHNNNDNDSDCNESEIDYVEVLSIFSFGSNFGSETDEFMEGVEENDDSDGNEDWGDEKEKDGMDENDDEDTDTDSD